MVQGVLVVQIFLSYRKGDGDYAGLKLDEGLSQVFGADAVFRAGRSIPYGDRYDDTIGHALKRCDVAVVIIGSNWLTSSVAGPRPWRRYGKRNFRRIDMSDDFVRREIREARENGATVIPVLLDGTPPLRPDDLPPDIAFLAYCQYVRFDLRTFDADTRSLVGYLIASHDLNPRRQPPQDVGPLLLVTTGPASATQPQLAIEPRHDGDLEIELVRRDGTGKITSRLSGHADRNDLRMIAEALFALAQ